MRLLKNNHVPWLDYTCPRLELDCTGRGQYRSFSTIYRNLYNFSINRQPLRLSLGLFLVDASPHPSYMVE
jgi:hypothetical protein